MKKLTKEQLIDLIFDRCNEIAIKNSSSFEQHISEIVKESQNDGAKMTVDFVTAYGNEMRKECCQTFAEILYEILYSE
ncbi:MAG: hypothetical protein NC312_09220 [Bacteroides fragilis]|nr:hypothetical protein [Bacteroides fragilis]